MFKTLSAVWKDKTLLVTLTSTFAGWGTALALAPILPEILSLSVPPLIVLSSATWVARRKIKALGSAPNTLPTPDDAPHEPMSVEADETSEEPASSWVRDVSTYIGLLGGLLAREHQNNNIDKEIVDKVDLLLAKVSHLLPSLEEFDMTEQKHKVERLVMQDLNNMIVPFTKLPAQTKIQNRRRILDGLKEIDKQITSLITGFQQRDMMDFEKGIMLISKRYNNNDIY